MSNIDTLLERTAAEIRDASATLADRHWNDIATPRRGLGRATLVAAAFAATILLVGGTALVFSAISGPSSNTFDGSVNEQLPPVADETTPPTTAFVTQSADAVRKLTVDRVTASSELSPAFAAENLIDGDPAISWNDASLSGEGAVLTFEFGERVFLDTIVIYNRDDLRDPRSFKRNARIKDIEVEYHTASGSMHLKATAPDTTEPFTIPVGALHDGPLVIRVLSVWPAEAVGDAPPFLELAIGEVEFFGTIINDEWTESEWMESAIRDMQQTIAAFEAEIATLTSALETASDDADELRDRLASANSGRDAAVRRLLELHKRLTQLNESRQ
ncbi:MAG: hypothetical protein M5U23_12020 [Acidimicrobiia bacterium]|nr:hypothetical protein [Acidimicrobiia bacterium]